MAPGPDNTNPNASMARSVRPCLACAKRFGGHGAQEIEEDRHALAAEAAEILAAHDGAHVVDLVLAEHLTEHVGRLASQRRIVVNGRREVIQIDLE